jgi:16S rRNA U516 pseudouridylate synthase RsuA-like enzyme
MCEAVGCQVTRLHRLSVGGVAVEGLEVGGVRRVEGAQLASLQAAHDAAAAAGSVVGFRVFRF